MPKLEQPNEKPKAGVPYITGEDSYVRAEKGYIYLLPNNMAEAIIRNYESITAEVPMAGILALLHTSHLEFKEEAFSNGFVPTFSFAAHVADGAVRRQQRLIALAGILAAPFGVNDQTRFWLSLCNSHIRRVAEQSCPVLPHRPANRLACVEVSTSDKSNHPGADVRDDWLSFQI